MEEFKHEQMPPDSIERYLERVEEGSFLQFNLDGFKVFHYHDTKELRLFSAEIGNWSETYMGEYLEPILVSEATDLSSIYTPLAGRNSPEETNGTFTTQIDSKDYIDWKNRLMQPSDIIKAAEKELARRETEGDEGIIACNHCKGEMHFEVTCSCIEDARTALEEENKTESPPVRVDDETLIDPNCENCSGTGKFIHECPSCEGSGKMSKYPLLVLTNEITDERKELKIDLATLIVNGDVSIGRTSNEYTDGEDFQSSSQIMWFDVSPYICRNIEEIGLDPVNTARMLGDQIILIDPEESNIIANRASWSKAFGIVKANYGGGPKFTKPADILELSQIFLASIHNTSEGGLRNEDGIFVGSEWLMRPIRPTEETIKHLTIALEEYNYALGLTTSALHDTSIGSAAFFIMDRSGLPLYGLSSGFEIREALENAWLRLQNMINLPFRSD